MAEERKPRIPVYVTPTELQRFRVGAARAGLSMSEFLRVVGLNECDEQDALIERQRAALEERARGKLGE